jgi:hypothetical protein
MTRPDSVDTSLEALERLRSGESCTRGVHARRRRRITPGPLLMGRGPLLGPLLQAGGAAARGCGRAASGRAAILGGPTPALQPCVHRAALLCRALPRPSPSPAQAQPSPGPAQAQARTFLPSLILASSATCASLSCLDSLRDSSSSAWVDASEALLACGRRRQSAALLCCVGGRWRRGGAPPACVRAPPGAPGWQRRRCTPGPAAAAGGSCIAAQQLPPSSCRPAAAAQQPPPSSAHL